MCRLPTAILGCLLLTLTLAVACGDDDPIAPVADPPVVVTEAVAETGLNSATLTGTVDAMGVQCSYWFEYGLEESYGSLTTEGILASTPAGARSVSGQLTNLDPETLYHYRLVARNDGGTSFGDDLRFATQIPNQLPETHAVYAPPDTVAAEVRWHVYWTGMDLDGEVIGFELRTADHGPDGALDPADSLGLPWTMTTLTDSLLTWPNGLGARTLFVRAIDNLGARDPSPAEKTITP